MSSTPSKSPSWSVSSICQWCCLSTYILAVHPYNNQRLSLQLCNDRNILNRDLAITNREKSADLRQQKNSAMSILQFTCCIMQSVIALRLNCQKLPIRADILYDRYDVTGTDFFILCSICKRLGQR